MCVCVCVCVAMRGGKETSLLRSDSVMDEFGVVAQLLESRNRRQHLCSPHRQCCNTVLSLYHPPMNTLCSAPFPAPFRVRNNAVHHFSALARLADAHDILGLADCLVELLLQRSELAAHHLHRLGRQVLLQQLVGASKDEVIDKSLCQTATSSAASSHASRRTIAQGPREKDECVSRHFIL